MTRTSSPVVLRPPVAVMRPVSVRTIPASNGLPGGVLYQPKVDGIRVTAHVLEGHAIALVTRRGTDVTERFSELSGPLAVLAPGITLDGEVVAFVPDPTGRGRGRFDFEQLLRTRANRAPHTAIGLLAFDLLSAPGKDLRGRPLSERWDMLSVVLSAASLPLQQLMATRDRREACAWFRDMRALGVEGLVAKGLDTAFEPGDAPGKWVKIRYADTTEAAVAGVVGTPRRPESVLVELPDGRRTETSPRLTAAEARQVADLLAGRLEPAEGGKASLWMVTGPYPRIEVLAGSGRHATVRYVRLRPEV